MRKYFKHINTLFLVLIALVIQAQENPLFVQGKEAYRANDFQGAITKWNQILDQGQHSPSLYYNLGNAHYKLNQVGPSIYYYEKALALDPNNAEVKNNLSFAENAKIDVIEPLPKTFFAKWDETLSNWFSYDEWAWITVISFFLFTVLFLTYYFVEGSVFHPDNSSSS
ncbi:MAG: tetratricopeptide repeat protein [Bacteroidota bacterium]